MDICMTEFYIALLYLSHFINRHDSSVRYIILAMHNVIMLSVLLMQELNFQLSQLTPSVFSPVCLSRVLASLANARGGGGAPLKNRKF
jgi:hypothetical protein